MSLTEEQKEECTEVFNFIDQAKRGRVTLNQLEDALGVLGKNVRKKELQNLCSDDFISLDTFLDICAKTVDFSKTEESLIDAFRVLDPDDSGYITKKDLAFVLKSYQPGISKKDIDNITKEANPDSEGKIDYRQFAKDMLAK